MVEECLPAELLDVVNRPDPAADARACDVPTFSLFDVIFRHVEEYDGLPDLLTLYAFILEAEQSAAAYARDYGGAVREFTKAQWVKAFPRVLDHPAAAEIVLACLRVQAVNARRVSVL